MLENKTSWILIALLSGFSVSIRAQSVQQPPDAVRPASDVLEEVVVTGSNFAVAANDSDVHVQVLGAKDLEASGIQSNPLELLRRTIPSFAGARSNTGNSNSSNTNQLTGGGSQIYLRGLPTLVLLNGRRITYNSLNASGGKNFVDVNMIPLSAIDHIEVLGDGASAIYGSDAIGGVVNMILKSNYSGAEVGGRHAQTNGNDYNENSAYFVAGAKNDSGGITVSGNWSSTAPLFQSQRPFISNDPRSNLSLPGSVGGNILSYGLNSPSQSNPTGVNATASGLPALIANGTYLPTGSPAIKPFNIAPYTSLLQKTDLRSVTLDVDFKVNDKLAFFGNALYSKTENSNQLSTSITNLVQVGVTVPSGSPFDPATSNITKTVVGTIDDPQQTLNGSRAYLFTVGAKGDIVADWNWEVGYTHSASRVEQRFTQTVFQPSFAAAIAGGYDSSGNAVAGGAYSKVISGFDTNGALVLQPALDPFARSGVNPAARANVYGTEVATTHASLGSGDAKIVGMPFSLPAGKVAFAVGAAVRRESLSATPDNNSYNFSTSPTKHQWASGAFFFDPFSHDRTVTAYYGEVRIPVTSSRWNVPGLHAFDLSVAGRAEHYSDAGDSKVPKLGVHWQPFDEQITARFTYSKSFVAPTLVDEFGPANYSLGPIPIPTGVNAGVIGYAGAGNNPSLAPAYAWSRALGLTLAPKLVPGLTASFDFVNVYIKGYQVGINSNIALPSVQALGAGSPYFNTVYVGAAPGQPGSTQAPLTAPGSLYAYLNSPNYANDFYYLDHKINASGHAVKALDFSFDYQFPTSSFGTFSAVMAGTYLITDRASTAPNGPLYQFAGYSGSIGVVGGSSAKWTTYTTFDWKFRRWDLTIGNFWRDHMRDINAGSIPIVWASSNPAVFVRSYMSWDASLGFTVGESSATDFRRFFHGLNIRVGANNVFNRMPPLALLSFPSGKGNSNADTATYSPIGRLVYLSGSVKF